MNDDNFEKMNRDNIPEVVIVKKVFADKTVRNRRRKWKLRHLDVDGMDQSSVNRDYTDFLEDLEEDPTFRQNIVIGIQFNRFVSDLISKIFRIFTRIRRS